MLSMKLDKDCLRVCVGEALLKLAFGLDSGILHVFEVLAHILHLVLELAQVFIFTSFRFNHCCLF